MCSETMTLSRIFNGDLFTYWELEEVVLNSADQWFLVFEYIGEFKNEWVYICHDPEIKQKLLASKKRRDLWRRFGAGDENSNMHGCIDQKRK